MSTPSWTLLKNADGSLVALTPEQTASNAAFLKVETEKLRTEMDKVKSDAKVKLLDKFMADYPEYVNYAKYAGGGLLVYLTLTNYIATFALRRYY